VVKKQSCRTCKWLRPHNREDGTAKSFHKNYVYNCDYKVTLTVMPDSVTTHYSFMRYLPKRHMPPDDGTQCPTYEART